MRRVRLEIRERQRRNAAAAAALKREVKAYAVVEGRARAAKTLAQRADFRQEADKIAHREERSAYVRGGSSRTSPPPPPSPLRAVSLSCSRAHLSRHNRPRQFGLRKRHPSVT